MLPGLLIFSSLSSASRCVPAGHELRLPLQVGRIDIKRLILLVAAGPPPAVDPNPDPPTSGHHSIRLRIEVKPDARHPGGVNVFGRGFGNYDQDIVLRLTTAG